MNILAVDTASQSMTAALRTDNFFEETTTSAAEGTRHSELLMPLVLDLCGRAGITLGDLDLLACTRGPGSFTGLRIGMSALKGISLGSGVPLVSVPTLEVYAKEAENYRGAVITAFDAKKRRYYLAMFECCPERHGGCSGKIKRLMPDTDGTAADLAPFMEPFSEFLVTGPEPDKETFCEILRTAFPEKNFTCGFTPAMSHARAIMALAEEQYKTKGPDSTGQGPVYIRKSDAETALEEKNAAGL